MPDQAFETAIKQVISREFPDFQALQECRQLTAGASQETYRITYLASDGEQKLALRRAQPGSHTESSVGGISLAAEARLFKLAHKHEIPSPSVLYELKPEDNLGAGFFMNWLEGETLGHRINRKPEFEEIRPKLAYLCGEILGRIHSIDWQSEKLDAFLEVSDTRGLIQSSWDQYRDMNIPVPMIDYTARWLLDNLPKQNRTTLVHSDFRNGNLMVNEYGIEAVLDWELAHIGDPVQDLGWLCVNSWRFGQRELTVGGFGQLDNLLAGYKATTGIEISAEQVKYWQVFGSFWWSVATLHMANTWRSGETPSLERPVIGRRTSEAQMDCVNLLIPGAVSLPDLPALTDGAQLPMAAELLESVMDFLKTDIAPNQNAHTGFLARVAANSLSIAQRELLIGQELANAEEHRLEALLDERADINELRNRLCTAIRNKAPLNEEALTQHLRQTVAGQLLIDQPNYSALQQAAHQS